MANVLIIDDDEMMCDILSRSVRAMGHESTCALTLRDGLKEAASEAFDVIFLDVRLPDGNGLDVLPKIKDTPYPAEVIIITAEGDPDGAELAIKAGAWDYIEKPSSVVAMTLPLVRALQYREEKKAKKPLLALKRGSIVGNSPRITSCLDLLAQASRSEASVLITGETGTGKELFAQAVHDNSDRSNGNFVVVDCATLPEALVESVLFGHEKGAFTGANNAHVGLIKQADRGTLFLDEVGELPLSVQKAFLRVFQERCFRAVGGNRVISSNFRLVSATNRDLDKMAQHARFRQDLLFRLRSFTIELPPLRECREDIKELTMYHTAKLCERDGIETKGFSPEFFEALAAYEWPGNVRELVNTLEMALVTSRHEPTLFSRHLPAYIRIKVARARISKKTRSKRTAKGDPADLFQVVSTLRDFREAAIEEAEKQYLRTLMSVAGKNIKEACQVSGLSRARLYALLKKHQVKKP